MGSEHDFQASLGVSCPVCKNKTERKLLKFLLNHFANVIYQFTQEWCKNIETDRHLPFDFCIPDYKIIIELDGIQHFRDVNHWRSSAKDNQERDKYKMMKASEQNYSIIRLYQIDVWKDTYDWKNDLLQAIELCKLCLQVILCSKNKELYVDYKEFLSKKPFPRLSKAVIGMLKKKD